MRAPGMTMHKLPLFVLIGDRSKIQQILNKYYFLHGDRGEL